MGLFGRPMMRVAGASLGTAATVQGCFWLVSRRVGRVNVVDVAWGPGLAGIATVSALLGERSQRGRGLAVAGFVTGWATRLSLHVGRAAAGRGEDPRYAEMLDGAGKLERIVKVFVTQGLAQWVVSLPVQVAATRAPGHGRASRAVRAVGTVLAGTGIVVEALADHQKRVWKAELHHGGVMARGLWAWSRHPNYFGDACFWWGVYLVCAGAGDAAWTIVSPALMSWSLVEGTGARRAERMHAGEAEYAAYRDRVSFFVPRPPKRY